MLVCFITGNGTLGVNFDHLLYLLHEAVIFVLVLCCSTLAFLALCKYMLCVKIKDAFVSPRLFSNRSWDLHLCQ